MVARCQPVADGGAGLTAFQGDGGLVRRSTSPSRTERRLPEEPSETSSRRACWTRTFACDLRPRSNRHRARRSSTSINGALPGSTTAATISCARLRRGSPSLGRPAARRAIPRVWSATPCVRGNCARRAAFASRTTSLDSERASSRPPSCSATRVSAAPTRTRRARSSRLSVAERVSACPSSRRASPGVPASTPRSPSAR